MFSPSPNLAIGEMISILQEYGETVCVVGSCLSIANVDLFFRGDTSVALFPLLPHVCGHVAGQCKATQAKEQNNQKGATPKEDSLINLAGRLIALGAPLIGRMDGTNFDLLNLISQVNWGM